MPTRIGCRARLPAGEFALHPLDPQRDTDALHAWHHDPEVARFWEMAWTRDAISRYLRQQPDSTHSTPYVGFLNGIAMSYWELYRADLDPLAEHYRTRDGDAGVHLLLGPAGYRGLGIGADLLRAVSGWQLETADRVVAEPDVRNERSVRAFERAGFRRGADIDLPDKRAALMIRGRGGA
ncbi:MAG: GNAT family N-acetyltransferase [Pseudonocardiaceae bacterium]|nr:GNAT family N-acetyltransferase [Pseudonocardiaceae bacterium]